MAYKQPVVPAKLVAMFGEPRDVSVSWASWRCPRCGEGKYFTLLYNMDSGWLSCHRNCGYPKMGPRDIGVTPQAEKLPVAKPEIPDVEWHPVSPLTNKQAYEYLTIDRGLTPDEVEEHARLLKPPGYFGKVHDLRYVHFPVWSDGKVVTWHARYCGINPSFRKWLSPRPDTGWENTKATLWGLDRMWPDEPVWVTEGILDALYFPHGVSQMGIESFQIQRVMVLDRRPSVVYIVRDSDAEGQRQTDAELVAAWRKLDRYVPLEIVNPPEGYKDFGELLAEGRRYDG